jgi:hypothetical protein
LNRSVEATGNQPLANSLAQNASSAIRGIPEIRGKNLPEIVPLGSVRTAEPAEKGMGGNPSPVPRLCIPRRLRSIQWKKYILHSHNNVVMWRMCGAHAPVL